MGRQPCCDEKTGIKKGPWTAEEDRKLSNFMMLSSNGGYHACWKDVPKLAGLMRCGKSCRLRWINYLRPDLKRGNLSEEEEDLIIALHEKLGNRWSKIAGHLPGRTDNEIKNCWNTRIKRRLKKMGIDPANHRSLLPLSGSRPQHIPSAFQQAAGYNINPTASSGIRVLRSSSSVVNNNSNVNNSAFKDYNATNSNAMHLLPAMSVPTSVLMPVPVSVMPTIPKTDTLINSGVMLDGSVNYHAGTQSAMTNATIVSTACDQLLYAAGSVPPKIEQIAPNVNYASQACKLMLQPTAEYNNQEYTVNKSKFKITEGGIGVNSISLEANEVSLNQLTCKDSIDPNMQDSQDNQITLTSTETLAVAIAVPSLKSSMINESASMADSNNLSVCNAATDSGPINTNQADDDKVQSHDPELDNEPYVSQLQHIPHQIISNADKSEESTESSSTASSGANIISVANDQAAETDDKLWSPSCTTANDNKSLQAIMMMELYNPWEDSLIIEGQQINPATGFDDLGQELDMVQIQHSYITSSNNNSTLSQISNNNVLPGPSTVNMHYPLWSSTTQLFSDELLV